MTRRKYRVLTSPEMESTAMLERYIELAVQRRECEFLDEDGIFYCSIPGLRGVWSAGATMEACVEDLRSGLVDWIQLGIEMGHEIPAIDGLELTAANVN